MISLLFLICPNRLLRTILKYRKSALIESIYRSKYEYHENKKAFLKRTTSTTIVCVSNGTGGITDRLKSFVSVCDWCWKNGIGYKIYSKEPFDFNHFFLPAQYDWSFTEEEYEGAIKGKCCLHLCLYGSGKKSSNEWEEEQKVLYKLCRSHRFSHIFIHRSAAYGHPEFGRLFRELFTMSPMLSNNVAVHQSALGKRYFAVALRFVNLLCDSVEDVSGIDPISEEEQQRLMNRCLVELKELMKRHPDKRFLLTTDSYRFITFVDEQQIPNVHFLVGEKVHHHIGFVRSVAENEVLKSLTEFVLISQAEQVFQIQTGPMYESKFPKWAATISDAKYEIIYAKE